MSARSRRAVAALIAAMAVPAGILAASAAASATPRHQSASPSVTNARLVPWSAAARISAGEGEVLTRLYARYRHIPATDIARTSPGALIAQLRGGVEWAIVGFDASSRASAKVQVGFQDGGRYGVFHKTARGRWQIAGLGGEPLGCGTALPASVRRDWHLAGCVATGRSAAAAEGPKLGITGTVGDLIAVATANVGVSDTPASTNWNLDCNPYTALEASASSSGCGDNSKFNILNENELWCADFAKYVWSQAGVSSDLGTLSPAASSFVRWAYQQGDTISFGGTPTPGDAVVFFPAGTSLSALKTTNANGYPAADHVAIDVGTTSGNPDLVNGDFMGSSNISVQRDNDIDLSSWSADIWGSGEKWVNVSSGLPNYCSNYSVCFFTGANFGGSGTAFSAGDFSVNSDYDLRNVTPDSGVAFATPWGSVINNMTTHAVYIYDAQDPSVNDCLTEGGRDGSPGSLINAAHMILESGNTCSTT